MNCWGHKLKLSIFGESHGPAIGIVIDGLPVGEAIYMESVRAHMARRAPGRDEFSTARKEADQVEILSGLLNNKITGSPLCGVIKNTDARSRDYDSTLRPGHADWTALLKYQGYADMRGGGHFSGRLTAPLVFAGSLARQILERRGIKVYARICCIGGFTDSGLPSLEKDYIDLHADFFPVYTNEAKESMKKKILEAKLEGDSVGGIIEAVAFGVPAALGEPFFLSMESHIASMLFSIPAVKGVEFGDGFKLTEMRGSKANDQLKLTENGSIEALSNHNGGINGGITNGMPLVLRAAIKPTPSIYAEQQSVNSEKMKNVTFRVKGRHDPCIVPRAVVVIESALALCLLDMYLLSGIKK